MKVCAIEWFDNTVQCDSNIYIYIYIYIYIWYLYMFRLVSTCDGRYLTSLLFNSLPSRCYGRSNFWGGIDTIATIFTIFNVGSQRWRTEIRRNKLLSIEYRRQSDSYIKIYIWWRYLMNLYSWTCEFVWWYLCSYPRKFCGNHFRA
jgi:hypothetical protein